MVKPLKQFSKVGRNKYTRQLLSKQKALKRGRMSVIEAPSMSIAAGRSMPYMHERDDTKTTDRRIKT